METHLFVVYLRLLHSVCIGICVAEGNDFVDLSLNHCLFIPASIRRPAGLLMAPRGEASGIPGGGFWRPG